MKANRLLFIFMIIVLFSCKKQETGASVKFRQLTEKAWVVQKQEERQNNDPWVDMFPFWNPCEKDNRWIFKPDYSMELNESANACSGSTPGQVLDIVTWSFSDNKTKLTVDNILFTIEQLNNTNMIISYIKHIGSGDIQVRITLGH